MENKYISTSLDLKRKFVVNYRVVKKKGQPSKRNKGGVKCYFLKAQLLLYKAEHFRIDIINLIKIQSR